MGVILLLAAGAAQAVTIPSKSVVNPLTETVYAPANPDNAAGRIRVYQRTENIIKGWKEETGKTIYMPSPTAKIFGLAVSADGTKLYVSVSNAYLSKLRVINLDASGLPTGSAPYFDYTDASWTAGTYDSPTGLAVAENPASGKERVYMTDSANQIHYFDQNPDGSWSLTGNVTEGLTGMGNIYDVVIGPVQQIAPKEHSPGVT